ncbi:hypothetical protein GC170_05135 [bacterium]|nr:hypothetical protein [bacterium]
MKRRHEPRFETLSDRTLPATFMSAAVPPLATEDRSHSREKFHEFEAASSTANPNETHESQVAPFSNASATINLPHGTAPAGGWPVVFLFNGDGMGAVGDGAQAANLSKALLKQGIATAVVSYPNLVNVDTFEKSIVAVLQNAAGGRLAEYGKINPQAFGVAGFSAGGFVTTFLLAKYAHGYGYDLQGGISFYGFVDTKTWFEYHRSEAKGILPTDPVLAGGKDPNSICFTPRGPARCRDHSAEMVSVVESHMAGASAAKLESLSTTNVIDELTASGRGSQVAPIFGVFGSNDSNIVPAINERQIRTLWSQAGAEYHYVTYNGTHGAEWSVSPESVTWLVGRLSRNSA